jgi:ABC-type glycerol-3-phosphate transport system substrate-binding protein
MALDQLATAPFRWRVLPPPRQARAANLLIVTGIAIGRDSPNERAGRDFVDYLLSPPVQHFLQLDSYGIPASLTPEREAHQDRHAAVRTVLHALLPDAHPFTLAESVALRAAGGALEMTLAGAIPPALAIQQMQQAATAALAALPTSPAGEPAVA